MHERYRVFGEQFPPSIARHLNIWPAMAIGKHHHNGLRVLMDFVFVLTKLIAPPSLLRQV